MATSDSYSNFSVWLELQRRNEIGGDRAVNRIPLFITEINIITTKTVPTIPVPFKAVFTGESETLAFDMGIAQKSISLTGVLLNQRVSKDSGENDGSPKERILSPFEMAQLIHSYVDSSAAQDDQSMNKLIILMPSRIDTNFEYHTAGDETKDISELPLIPFTFKNRRYDERFKRVFNDLVDNVTDNSLVNLQETETSLFADVSSADELSGMSGFIRSFNTTFAGEQGNTVPFTLEFEVARVLSENPINSL
jgi:hypothetical protein